MDSLALVGQPLTPNVHHITQVVVIPPVMLQQHITNALLAFQDLLEEDEVLILHRVDVAGQVLADLLDSQMLRGLVIFIQL